MLRLAGVVALWTLAASCAASQPATDGELQPASSASTSSSATPDLAPSVPLDADFDADGSPDVAFGSGLTSTGELTEDDGTVIIVYGSVGGLTPQRTQTWRETDFAGPITTSFGDALAAGDFDGDGFSDLAVGAADAPVDDVDDHAGFVRIIYGSRTGLRADRSQRWTQNSRGIAGRAEAHDGFGIALVAANFGHGGEHDLAIGVHGEDHDAGAVNVIYGSPTGLTADHDQLWDQNSQGIADRSERDDAFGLTLTAGRFRDSDYADLVVGVYSETVKRTYGSGAVHIINGSPDGLTSQGSQFLTFSDGQAKSQQAAGFSYALATGRFHGGDTDDLAVGAPFADGNTGAVTVIPSTSGGLHPDRAHVFDHTRLGIQKSPDGQDTIGWALTAGQFGHDDRARYADLAIRVPGHYTKTDEVNGALTILYGGPEGLTTQQRQTLTTGLSSEAFGIDVEWRRQLAAIGTADGLDQLILGDTDWIRILTPTANGFTHTAPPTWTTDTLNHEDIWYGIADKVAG